MLKKKGLKIALLSSSLLLAIGGIATEMTSTWQIAIDRYLPGSTTSGVNNGEYVSDYSTAKDLVIAKRNLIADIVSEGTTLLKNENNTLPLADNAKVSLFSRNSVKMVYGSSSGGGKVSSNYNLKDTLEERGVKVNQTLWDFYSGIKTNPRSSTTTGYNTGEIAVSEYTDAVKSSYTQYGDAAIVVISRTFGEGNDVGLTPDMVKDGDGTHNALELQDKERAVIEEAKKCSNKVIVLINSDFAMDVDSLKHDSKIGAIVWAGSLGNSGIWGLCDVLTGKKAPSGHLPDTYAANAYNSAAFQNYGDFTWGNVADVTAASANNYVVYQEGIYVGYKYFETRYEDLVLNQGNANSSAGCFNSTGSWDYTKEVSYSFGYGLSYTTFERKINSINWDEETKKVTINATSKNTGSVAGKDVLQVYVNSPYTEYDKTNGVEKAGVSLVGFEKTKELKAGEEDTKDIVIDMDLVASYDAKKAKTYILDFGKYYFGLGNGAHDALNNILAAKGKSAGDGMDYEGDVKQVATYEKAAVAGKEVDDVTCSVSKYTGVKIANHLEKADVNYYGDIVTYLSRSNWRDTWSNGVVLNATEGMKDDLSAGSTYTPSAASSDLSHVKAGVDYDSKATSVELKELNGADYNDEKWGQLLNQLSLDEMSRLVGLANSGAIESINMPSYMAFDGPSGICASYITDDQEYCIYASMFEGEPLLSATFNKELAYEQGKMFGNDGLWTGYHCVWGPGNNTHRTAYLGRNTEYYSEDGVLASYITNREVSGAYEYGLSMGPKHFAFNDQETNRGGVSTFVNEQAAREIYLRAFEGALSSGKANCTMIAKNRVGAQYVGALSGLLQNILVDEWGYHGVVIADSASDGYVNGPTSIINGTTEFDTNTKEFVMGSLSPKSISEDGVLFAAVKEACHRNLYLWANTWLTATVGYGQKVKNTKPWYQVTSLSVLGVGAGLTAAIAALYVVSALKKEEK